MPSTIHHATFCCFILAVYGALDLSYGSDSDLTFYHSRPDIKAPILDVQLLGSVESDLVPGYFFVAPYASINQHEPAPRYCPCATISECLQKDGKDTNQTCAEQMSHVKPGLLFMMLKG